MNYILDGHTPVKEEDVRAWARWFEKADRRVALEARNGFKVSTVFLGIDHNFNEGEPILFETMVFGGEHDQLQERYPTWDEAVKGHRAIANMVFRP